MKKELCLGMEIGIHSRVVEMPKEGGDLVQLKPVLEVG